MYKERIFNPMSAHSLTQRELELTRAMSPVEEFMSATYTTEEIEARKALIIASIENIYTYYTTNTLDEPEEGKPVEDGHTPVVLPS